ncbi:MAG: hypothetical protein M1820_007130 [Bogoriella megaspora]|nr:MAG: hypothetical protein M1820_007130 [Bogoriella megaspora]
MLDARLEALRTAVDDADATACQDIKGASKDLERIGDAFGSSQELRMSNAQRLVEFLHHGNTQIRQIGNGFSHRICRVAILIFWSQAAENLVGYSSTQPEIFKTGQLTPVKDLKLLIKDYPVEPSPNPISKNALTILINLSGDAEVLKFLAEDNAFLESLLLRISSDKEANANEMCMLIANMAKSDSLTSLLTLRRDVPKSLSTSSNAMDQLMDCFVKGAEGNYNKHADYDYLPYFFADIAKHSKGRTYFTTPRKDDADIIPLSKLIVFTEHKSAIRRRGVASTIKNTCFLIASHPTLLSREAEGVNILPYLLLPLMGPEDYSDEDTEGMLEECQLLPPDKEREKDASIIVTHLETLLLLTTTRGGREVLRNIKVYPIVRELHSKVEHEGVREGVDRLVQVLMRDEAEREEGGSGQGKAEEDEDEDEQIVEVL